MQLQTPSVAGSEWLGSQPQRPPAHTPQLHSREAIAWGPLGLALLWLFATSWWRPLALPDEGRYVGVAWGMLTSGDWLTPHLNGLPYFHKPPLFYWMTAAALGTFGVHEWAARLAPLLGAASGTAATYVFVHRWWNGQVARWALLAVATQPMVFVAAQFANLDMLVAGCVAVAVLGFAHMVLARECGAPWRGAAAAAYLFTALGILAKGLIGGVLPALVIGCWLLLGRQWRQLPRLLWWPGVALFGVVALPWFVAMQLRFPDFFHYFFVVQHFSRFAQGGFNNAQPFWFFPVVLALLALPWSAWLLRTAPATGALPARRGLRHLMWTWLVVIVAFFSLPQSKLVGYVLPAVFPLGVLVADRFERLHSRHAVARTWWQASTVLALVACLAALALPTKSTRTLALALREHVGPQERVVSVGAYDFDLPVYARLRHPVVILEDWQAPQARKDNWRKELADAGQFDAAAAASLLLPASALKDVACDGRATWVIGPAGGVAGEPTLQPDAAIASADGKRLWRIPAQPRRDSCGAVGGVQ
jgi:4-amino-4-deoxy-L-arabinose transferase-like glycosyltransferase